MTIHLSNFRPLTDNPNGHTLRGQKALEDSIREDGYTEPMVAAADLTVLSGNQRLETVAEILDLDPIIVESDGTRPVIHIRRDIPNADSPLAKRVIVRSNRVAEIDLAWNPAILAGGAIPAELITSLWNPDELSAMGDAWAKREGEPVDLTPPQGNGDQAGMHQCPKCGFAFHD
jgi:hypothetical protein